MNRTPYTTPTVVRTWTGVEVRALREAKRLTVRQFGEYLGVTDRMISKWEAGGPAVRPRPFNQQALDICLARCTPEERRRFALGVHSRSPAASTDRRQWAPADEIVQRCLERDDMRRALAERDIARVFRILNAYGLSQRRIAAMTEQSQSEISEILGGRQVLTYELLTRIASGLGVPREYMGLAYDKGTLALMRRSAAAVLGD